MAKFAPTSRYTNYYDIARFKLTWHLNLILLLFLPFLAIILFYLGENAAYPSLIGVVLCIVVFFVLKRTKSYIIPAILYSVVGVTLSQFTLIFFPEAYHFVDPAWMMIIILYTYFTLGKVWGSVAMGASLLGIAYYILFVLDNNVEMTKDLGQEDAIALAINFMVCGIIIGYLIFQFLKVNEYAENKYIRLTSTLKDKNNEKSILLREIHHRVKNNLQVVTSLLRLQSRDIEDVKYQALYKESINRVLSMAMIHEKIYQSSDMAKIDLQNYIESLANDLVNSYSVDSKIELSIDSNLENLKPETLVPLALIFNELISNSIKHAFLNRDHGKITIKVDNRFPIIKIKYSDNGIWKEQGDISTLGLELIDSLTEQLDGTFLRSSESGTHYIFKFNFEE